MLYLDHFGLDEPPFRITPHTDFFFDGADRGATLEALLYAILHDEGIVKVSGEVGSGKTMLCRVLMERLPHHVEIVYLANPSLARDEILHAVADDLKVAFSQGRTSIVLRELQEHLVRLYSEGRRVVILIDEAHAMPEETLEQVRLLSNLESNRHKLLQIVLFGQPELDSVLDKASMRQLKDRITHSFRMRPLLETEVGKYLSFRMRAAGFRGPEVFNARSVAMIAKAASGLTRRINILADKSLLAAFTENTHAVTERQVRKAIRDSDFGRLLDQRPKSRLAIAAATLLAGLVLGVALHWVISREHEDKAPRPAPSFSGPLSQAKRTATGAAGPGPTPAPAAVQPVTAGRLPAAEGEKQQQSSQAAVTAPQGTPSQIRPADLPAVPAAATAGPMPNAASAPASATPSTARGPRLDKERENRVRAYRTGNNSLLKQRIESTLAQLSEAPDENYSIELFVTDNADPARTERFLMRARDLVPIEDVYVLPQAIGDKYRMRIAFGSFPDRESAAKAAERLPPKYRQAFQLELRSFAELRAPL